MPLLLCLALCGMLLPLPACVKRPPDFPGLARCSALPSPPAAASIREGTDPLGVASAPPPPPQPFVASEVPKPADVKDWSHPRISPDGQWLAFHFNTDATPDTFNIGIVHLDGSAFQCLTCALQIDAHRPVWFPDGRRLMFQTPKGLTNVFSILELDTGALFAINGMRSAHLLDHDRWTMLSPDGRKLAWTKVWGDGFRIVMGDLIRDTAGYHVEDVRWIYPPPLQEATDSEPCAQAFAWYENKQFIAGGRTLVFAGTRDQGSNLDVYRLDLVTGTVGRLTTHREWDEGGEFSPDGQWYAFETTRAHDVLSVLSNIPMPPFLDFALVLPIRNVTLTGPWFAPHEPFLLDRLGDRGAYIGQRLSAAGDDGWAIRGGVHWHPDGTRITWGEWLGPDRTDTRLFIGTFPTMTPGPAVAPQETPTPTWAPLLQNVELRPLRMHRVLQGQAARILELALRGRLPRGDFKAVFKDYPADEEHILNGEMVVEVRRLGVAQIRSDIQLSGGHTGFLKVDIQITGNDITGSAVSEKDGARFEKHFE